MGVGEGCQRGGGTNRYKSDVWFSDFQKPYVRNSDCDVYFQIRNFRIKAGGGFHGDRNRLNTFIRYFLLVFTHFMCETLSEESVTVVSFKSFDPLLIKFKGQHELRLKPLGICQPLRCSHIWGNAQIIVLPASLRSQGESRESTFSSEPRVFNFPRLKSGFISTPTAQTAAWLYCN